jgi:hypothetical protein
MIVLPRSTRHSNTAFRDCKGTILSGPNPTFTPHTTYVLSHLLELLLSLVLFGWSKGPHKVTKEGYSATQLTLRRTVTVIVIVATTQNQSKQSNNPPKRVCYRPHCHTSFFGPVESSGKGNGPQRPPQSLSCVLQEYSTAHGEYR